MIGTYTQASASHPCNLHVAEDHITVQKSKSLVERLVQLPVQQLDMDLYGDCDSDWGQRLGHELVRLPFE